MELATYFDANESIDPPDPMDAFDELEVCDLNDSNDIGRIFVIERVSL